MRGTISYGGVTVQFQAMRFPDGFPGPAEMQTDRLTHPGVDGVLVVNLMRTFRPFRMIGLSGATTRSNATLIMRLIAQMTGRLVTLVSDVGGEIRYPNLHLMDRNVSIRAAIAYGPQALSSQTHVVESELTFGQTEQMELY